MRAEAVGAVWLRCLRSVAGLTLGPNKPVSSALLRFFCCAGLMRLWSRADFHHDDTPILLVKVLGHFDIFKLPLRCPAGCSVVARSSTEPGRAV